MIDYKQMCIQQGYVPSTCTMEGQMCWLLVNSHGDPCKGCNANRNICKGRTYVNVDEEYNRLHHTLSWTNKIEFAQIEENEKRKEKIIEQRKAKHMDGFTRTILEVKWELCGNRDSFIEIIVKDVVDEKAYITKCKDIYEMLHIVRICCSKYNVEQIHIEENGLGASIYDSLVNQIEHIDIVPLRYVKMNL